MTDISTVLGVTELKYHIKFGSTARVTEKTYLGVGNVQGILIVHTGANGETGVFLLRHSGMTTISDGGIIGIVGKDAGGDIWVNPNGGSYIFQWLVLHANTI